MKKIYLLFTLVAISLSVSAATKNADLSSEKVRAAFSLELTCLTKSSLGEGESFQHSVRLMQGSAPVPNAVVKVNDPIGRICSSITTNSNGEAVWTRSIPQGTKQQLYTIEFFYGDTKNYSIVSVTGAANSINLKSYPVSLNITKSPDKAALVFGSRGGFSATLQSFDMTLREAAKIGKAAVDDYLSNPVNKLKTKVMITSCMASLLVPGPQAVCGLLVDDMAGSVMAAEVKLMLKKGLESTNFSPDAKKSLQEMLDLADLAYAVGELKPAEGLSKINAVGTAIDFVKNAVGQLIYIDGKLKGASFPAQKKGSDEVYVMCIYHDNTTTKPVSQPKAGSTTNTVASTLPADLRKLFFETVPFTMPLWFLLPEESSVQRFNDISSHPEVLASGGSSFPSTSITMYQSNDIENIDQYMMSFFVNSGYMKVESRTQTTRSTGGSSTTTYNFLFYSQEFKPYVKTFNISESYRQVARPFVMLAHRNLISIDYKNEYEDAPLGMKRTFYSIVFSYNLVNDLPGLPENNTVYKGKAKAFKDPDDGSWKISGPFENLGVKLGEQDVYTITEFLKTKYQPYKFERVKQGPGTTNSVADINNNTGNYGVLPVTAGKSPASEYSDNKMLISSAIGSPAKAYLSGNMDIYTDKKAGTKEKSNVLFLFYYNGNTDNIRPEYKSQIINSVKNWLGKSVNMTAVGLNDLKENTTFRVELILNVKILSIATVDAYIKTRIYIVRNEKVIADESFERSKSLLFDSKETGAIIDNSLKNAEKKISKVLSDYMSIQ